ncbi:MAG: UDP-N-acetylmuramoyl-L-alanyl-D-glutamate--2,6-diaminopimelate ligase [Firmicutes bacterium]|nr:UDP-N-acetylmuramoyl-L-alanyl-D-glutamate--2,6-diaminopimelate ligase [Bacillota bacterium]
MQLKIDSRKVENGDIFFCLKGSQVDGHDYAMAAAENGAAVIVYERDIPFKEDGGTIYIKVDDTLKALNQAADSLNGFPSKKLTMFGVTGTNGKSSISYMISNIYSKYVAPCGYMGTIGGKYNTGLTTADIIDMHSTLADMVKDGAKATSIEVSSHGLVQGRVDAVDFDYAIYTNLTPEHLDYFHDMDTYCKAKALFFQMLKPEAVAVINVDDKYSDEMISGCTGKVITYGIQAEKEPDYLATNIVYSFDGMEFDILHQGNTYHVTTNMHVTYNLYNLLAVAATLHQAGLNMEDVISEFVHAPSIPGRMDIIDKGQDFKVIVDYAHTDDSYQQLLSYVRNDIPGVNRIITVFGAPGKRDKENRRRYANWVGKFCDYTVLTEEDYRDESPADIAKDISSNFPEGYQYDFVEDRYEAIKTAIEYATKGDVVLILGKGAENYLDKTKGKEFWMGDDEAAKEILKAYMDCK